MRGVLRDPPRDRDGVRVQRRHVGLPGCQRVARVGYLGGREAARLGLEEQVDRAFSRLMSAPGQAFTLPR